MPPAVFRSRSYLELSRLQGNDENVTTFPPPPPYIIHILWYTYAGNTLQNQSESIYVSTCQGILPVMVKKLIFVMVENSFTD